uniref:Ig-like domain-containing protein n=1 Tax=Poecilia formosa TaxID=48698 RepID=A0A096LXF6_POEFO
AVTVEVQEGEPYVVLPCQINKRLEEIVTVKWSRFDLNPNTVHQRDVADDLQGQNQVFRGRTSMIPEALDSSDFSLTLRKPQLLDSGIYICSMTENQEETALSGVQLHVKVSVPVLVLCPCLQISFGLLKCIRFYWAAEPLCAVQSPVWSHVEITCSVTICYPESSWAQYHNTNTHIISNASTRPEESCHTACPTATVMDKMLSFPGFYGLSLRLHHCEHQHHQFCCCQCSSSVCFSVYRVEVDSGEESVLLPFKTAVRLPERVRVRWRHNNRKMVHINDRNSNGNQHWLYKNRTKIKEKSKFGDFSLTLKKPTSRDTGTYSCTVYKDSSDEILTMKQVLLKVKGQYCKY